MLAAARRNEILAVLKEGGGVGFLGPVWFWTFRGGGQGGLGLGKGGGGGVWGGGGGGGWA